jgi:hypothetical protein
MANIVPNVKRAPQGAQSIILATWTLGASDTGIEVDLSDYVDRSIQVEGTFGGATVTVEGSNDSTNWESLRDPQGTILAFSAAGLKQVLEATLKLRVRSAGGTGTTVTVTLFGRTVNPLAWS